MTRSAWAACAVLMWPLDAAASEVDHAETLPTWTIGAGIDFAGPSIGGASGAAGLGYAGPLLPSTTASLLIERRIAHPLWLIGRLRGGYDRTVHEDNGYVGRAESLSGEGAIGLRVVFTPDDPFQFSTFGLLGVGYARSRYEPSTVGEARAWNAGLDLGFALDRELIEGLGLRLGVVVGEVGYASARTSYFDGLTTRDGESSTWSAALSLSPSIELRYSF